METDNSGVIGFYESRENIDKMKQYYREEYKKLVDKEKKADSDLFHNKWKVRFGSFAVRVGLIFRPNSLAKSLTRIGTHAFSFLSQKIMKWKNKKDKEKYKKQRDQLTADFINAEGEFAQFSVNNDTTFEPIDEKEEERIRTR